jgi:Secretion system C-terminal sorting domain
MRLFLLLGFMVYTLTSTAQQWKKHTPPLSGLIAYSLDTDRDTALFYGLNGYWLSYNYGENWYLYRADYTPFLREWSKVLVENGIWYGIHFDNTISVSKNKGASWQRVVLANTLSSTQYVDVVNGRLFVKYNERLYYTTDLGLNWRQVKSLESLVFTENSITCFQEKYYLLANNNCFRINEVDSLERVSIPMFTPSNTIISIEAGLSNLFILYNSYQLICSNDGFVADVSMIDLPEYPANEQLRLLADPYSEAIAVGITDGISLQRWYYAENPGANWRYVNTVTALYDHFDKTTFTNQNFISCSVNTLMHENMSNDKTGGAVRDVNTKGVLKVVATQKNLFIKTDFGEIQRNSISVVGNWQLMPYIDFNYEKLHKSGGPTFSLFDLDDQDETVIKVSSFADQVFTFLSNEKTYVAWKSFDQGPYRISVVDGSQLVNTQTVPLDFSAAIFHVTENALILQNRFDRKILIYNPDTKYEVKEDYTCGGLEQFVYNSQTLLKFCDGDGFVLEQNTNTWRELRVTDESTGSLLRLNRINFVTYLNTRYWLGVDGKGLYYANDLSGAFYPYEIPLPENTPVAMSINYGKIWVAMRSGNIYSLQLPSVTNENKNDFQLTLSPNPTPFGICYLNANLNVTTDVTLRIFDLQGKLVSESTQSGGDQWIIDAPGLPQGMYLVQLSSNDVVKTVRWIKGL